VRELVQRFLDSGYTVVVASSAKEDELGALLERAGVRDLIDSQTSSDDAAHSKPDPDIVRAAVSRSGASPEAAIMIGDTPYDVEAARRAGVRIVGVESGGWRRQDLDGAEEVYGSPSDLWERYDESIFAQMSPDRARGAGDEGAPPSIDMNIVALIAAGVAGLALLALAIRAIARKRSGLPDGDEPVAFERAGLSPRDRERLRHLIERTS
jgi:soluble P-type ATPase